MSNKSTLHLSLQRRLLAEQIYDIYNRKKDATYLTIDRIQVLVEMVYENLINMARPAHNIRLDPYRFVKNVMVNCRTWKDFVNNSLHYAHSIRDLYNRADGPRAFVSNNKHPLPQAFRWHYKPRLINPVAITLLNDKDKQCRIKAVDTSERLEHNPNNNTNILRKLQAIELLDY